MNLSWRVFRAAKNFWRWSLRIFLVVAFSSCANEVLKYEHSEHLNKIEEFDQQVKIVEPAEAGQAEVPATNANTANVTTHINATTNPAPEIKGSKKAHRRTRRKEKAVALAAPVPPLQHEPDLEGQEGFVGRRPLKDPYQVHESVQYQVSYLGMTAGALKMENKDFVEVNGRKSYHFVMTAETLSVFSSIFKLQDQVENLIDYETLTPTVFTLHVKHPHELRESRYLFERSKGLATFWEKKVTDKEGEQERKLQWETPDYSQNVFSAVFYVRAFPWKVDDERAFRVADDGQNLIFRAKAIRKEKIKIAAGEFDAIVLNPKVELRGVAKPMGDIYIWLSDDDRKLILKIEGKIKIGTLVFEAEHIDLGRPN